MQPAVTGPLQGASNFRDLGGYATTSGQRVRRGLVFRSDHLGGLTPDDVAHIQRLGIGHSLDFRGVAESSATPYAIPAVQRVPLSIEPTVIARMKALVAQGVVPTREETVDLMRETYRDFVNHNAGTFRPIFKAPARGAHAASFSLHRGQRPHWFCRSAVVVGAGRGPRHHHARLPADQPTLPA